MATSDDVSRMVNPSRTTQGKRMTTEVTLADIAARVRARVPHAKRIVVHLTLEESYPRLGRNTDTPTRVLYGAFAKVTTVGFSSGTEYSFGSAIRPTPEEALEALLHEVALVPPIPDDDI